MQVADVKLQKTAMFSSLRYFIDRFPVILPAGATSDYLEAEFQEYGIEELPAEVTQKETTEEQWAVVASIKDHNGLLK